MTFAEAVAKRDAARTANVTAQANSAKADVAVNEANAEYHAFQAQSQQQLAVLNDNIQKALAAKIAAFEASNETQAAYDQTQIDVKQAMLDEDQQGTAGQENPGNTGPLNTR